MDPTFFVLQLHVEAGAKASFFLVLFQAVQIFHGLIKRPLSTWEVKVKVKVKSLLKVKAQFGLCYAVGSFNVNNVSSRTLIE